MTERLSKLSIQKNELAADKQLSTAYFNIESRNHSLEAGLKSLSIKSNPWAEFTDSDFDLTTGKLGGKWFFNDLFGKERPKSTGFGKYNSHRGGPQNDCGVIGRRDEKKKPNPEEYV